MPALARSKWAASWLLIQIVYPVLGSALLIAALPAAFGATSTNQAAPPPAPPAVSPVDFFRQLLAAGPSERGQILSRRPEAKRKYLEAKLEEYDRLSAGERERRLQLLELRWVLVPLLRTPPADREGLLKQIPPAQRPWVEMRLQRWDQIDRPQQAAILENDLALDYFVQAGSRRVSPPLPGALGRPERAESSADPARDRPFKHLEQFFELSEKEKQKTLAALSESDRETVDRILPEFDRLEPSERKFCLEAFRRFTEMTPGERAQFKKSADRWRNMSEQERTAWRQLVTKIPPLPPGADQPPFPPGLLQASNVPSGAGGKSAARARSF